MSGVHDGDSSSGGPGGPRPDPSSLSLLDPAGVCPDHDTVGGQVTVVVADATGDPDQGDAAQQLLAGLEAHVATRGQFGRQPERDYPVQADGGQQSFTWAATARVDRPSLPPPVPGTRGRGRGRSRTARNSGTSGPRGPTGPQWRAGEIVALFPACVAAEQMKSQSTEAERLKCLANEYEGYEDKNQKHIPGYAEMVHAAGLWHEGYPSLEESISIRVADAERMWNKFGNVKKEIVNVINKLYWDRLEGTRTDKHAPSGTNKDDMIANISHDYWLLRGKRTNDDVMPANWSDPHLTIWLRHGPLQETPGMRIKDLDIKPNQGPSAGNTSRAAQRVAQKRRRTGNFSEDGESDVTEEVVSGSVANEAINTLTAELGQQRVVMERQVTAAEIKNNLSRAQLLLGILPDGSDDKNEVMATLMADFRDNRKPE